MSIHLQRQFDRLKKSILTLGAVVEESVEKSLRSIEQRDPDLAAEVIEGDQRIDLMEVDVEEECLHTLALHQPVAFDLRFVIATLKINSDLERIGDQAANVAEQTQMLASDLSPISPPFDLRQMGRTVRDMLKKSLDALVNVDPELAEEVCALDTKVDELHRESYDLVAEAMRERPHEIKQLIQMLSVSRRLERMADHCVNIAQDVLYMARGDIARHRSSTPDPVAGP
jgi:phosphate transport system protein